MTPNRAAIYARISVATEESVSIKRQLQAGKDLAKSRGWTVVAEHKDEGVSATRHRPEERSGWARLLDQADNYDVVIIWKIDRLARNVLDFLHATHALERRQASLVAVSDPIDMTTPQGTAFATLLAVFAQMEAAAISERVKASRRSLIASGRVVGGSVPYGWRTVPNPHGAGKVLELDPDRSGVVREMVDRVFQGETVYSITKWLTESGAPPPRADPEGRRYQRKYDGFNYVSVERLLRSPVLAGMRPHQPGRGRNERADPTAVLRDERGLPVVNEEIAIISVEQHRKLLDLLDNRSDPATQPRASKGSTPTLFSRLVRCADCRSPMHRGSGSNGRAVLRCTRCYQSIGIEQLTAHVEERLLSERGDRFELVQEAASEDTSAELQLIEISLMDLTQQMVQDGVDLERLVAQVKGLKERRHELRNARPITPRFRRMGPQVQQRWQASNTDEERRGVLASQIESFEIRRGQRGGRVLDPTRVQIRWKPDPEWWPSQAGAD